MKASFLSLRR